MKRAYLLQLERFFQSATGSSSNNNLNNLNNLNNNSSGEQKVALSSIYFGGGTPSLADASTIEAICAVALRYCSAPSDLEITIEANPTVCVLLTASLSLSLSLSVCH
jgi:hypothetical protein